VGSPNNPSELAPILYEYEADWVSDSAPFKVKLIAPVAVSSKVI
jgi:hypothetical protein